jgi:hypothetical protein
MEIIRSAFQEPKNQTLQDDVLKYDIFPISRNSEEKQALLKLLERLSDLPDSKRVYATVGNVCSIYFAAQDVPNFEDMYLVSFSILTSKYNYSAFLSYRVPDHAAPWNNACVHTSAYSEDDLVQMILKAIDLSEGWHEKKFG